MPDTIGTISPIDTSSVEDAMASINAGIEASREKFADAFEYGIDSALRGDWKGVLSAIFGSSFEDGLKNIGRSLFDALGGGKANSGSGGFNLASIGSTISKFFGGFPGFATGGSFTVGGAGGPDSKLFGLRLTPGEMVDVRKPGADQGPSGGGGTPMVFDMRGALLTADLLEDVNQKVAAGSASAIRTSTTIARKGAPAAQQSMRRLGRA